MTPEQERDEALSHLGNVLYIIQDIIADKPWDILVAAVAFYNEKRPDHKVVPEWDAKQ